MVSNGIWFDSVDVCAQAVMCTVCLWLPLCVCNHTRKCVYVLYTLSAFIYTSCVDHEKIYCESRYAKCGCIWLFYSPHY